MKKFLAFVLAMAMTFNSYAAWDKAEPAGTRNISDIDLYVIANNTALEATLSGITGWKNLAVSYVGATSLSVTADMLLLQSSASIAYRATSVSETITITTAGASGLVVSLSEASNTTYYVWIARKSSDGTTNGYLSTTSDFTTFLTQVDVGYDQATLVSAVRNDGSSNFIGFTDKGSHYFYNAGQLAVSGSTSSAWTAIDTAAFVPSGISDIAFGTVWRGSSTNLAISNINTESTDFDTTGTNKFRLLNGANNTSAQWQYSILTANTLYYETDGANGNVYIAGFVKNKI